MSAVSYSTLKAVDQWLQERGVPQELRQAQWFISGLFLDEQTLEVRDCTERQESPFGPVPKEVRFLREPVRAKR